MEICQISIKVLILIFFFSKTLEVVFLVEVKPPGFLKSYKTNIVKGQFQYSILHNFRLDDLGRT